MPAAPLRAPAPAAGNPAPARRVRRRRGRRPGVARAVRPAAAAALAGVVLLALATLTGCGEAPPVRTDAGPADARGGPRWSGAGCDPLPGPAARGAELVVALGEAVDPQAAPVPRTAAERVVFANCYETLTRVRCTGELVPGLAARWQRQDEGRRWLLHLREGAVFWDGTPVTAAAVIASWQRNTDLADRAGRPCPGLWLAAGGGLQARSARVLAVSLAEPQENLPRLLAHPALAVAAARPGWLWPVGSGPCRLAADTDHPRPDLVCRPNLHHPDAPAWRELRFRIHPGRDPRDLLPAGVDLTVIRDHAAAGFHATRAGVRAAPLPWDRIHALLLPARSPVPADAARALARDPALPRAAPADHARWDALFFHGCQDAACPQLSGPTVSSVAPPRDPDPAVRAIAAGRLVHPADDPDARALAERAAAFLPADLRVRGVAGRAFAHALQAGDAGAYVVALDACYPDACPTLAALLARADWLQAGAGEGDDPCAAARRLLADGWVVPLTRSRPHLVWRGPLGGLELAHDGTPLVHGLGPARPAELP